MNELQTTLDEIKLDKDTNLKPENLKQGITCLGITGTLKSGADTSDATAKANDIKQGTNAYTANGKEEGTLTFDTFNPDYTNCLNKTKNVLGETDVQNLIKFGSIEEMNQSTGNKGGDLAVIYDVGTRPVNGTDIFITASFPKTVILSSAIIDTITFNFKAADLLLFATYHGTLTSTKLHVEGYGMNTGSDNASEEIQFPQINYTSTDGITYTRDLDDVTTVVFNTALFYDIGSSDVTPWDDRLGQFFIIPYNNFQGLYQYNINKWENAPTQLTVTNMDVVSKTFYGKNGVERGILGNTVDSEFLDSAAEAYANIQDKYDKMIPRVLTQRDRKIKETTYCIPTKSNGTPLLDISQLTDLYRQFIWCGNLKTLPMLDTKNITATDMMCSGCTKLENVPIYDTSNMTSMSGMFNECPALSDESLNNIMQMCINSKETYKTLRNMGLSQEQATRCESLSNWQAFLDAGWTSGY